MAKVKNIPASLISKIEKLQALAKDGLGGEKINAQKKLKELLQRHKLSRSDLKQYYHEKAYTPELVYTAVRMPVPSGFLDIYHTLAPSVFKIIGSMAYHHAADQIHHLNFSMVDEGLIQFYCKPEHQRPLTQYFIEHFNQAMIEIYGSTLGYLTKHGLHKVEQKDKHFNPLAAMMN